MKTEKIKFYNTFQYMCIETYKSHGLDNTFNKNIGYWYQSNKKGFWLKWW
jgi:hypothetical protein